MNTTQNILAFVIESLGFLFLMMVILRFFLQLVRADFYNPFSQAIVKVTNPVLIPLRRVIPGIFGVDIAAIILALLVQLLIAELIYLVYAGTFYNPANVLIWGALGILKIVTYMYIVCLLALAISSFIAPYSQHPALMLVRELATPILRPIQNIIPSLGGLDFSVFFAFMGIIILQMILDATAASVQLLPALIIGF